MSFNPDSNKQLFNQRLTRLYIPIYLVFAILGIRFWQLQILNGSEYAQLAEQNRVRIIPLVAPRGTVVDRHNIPLVENRSAFNILLYREEMKDLDATSRFIIKHLRVNPEDLAARLKRSRTTGLYKPVVVKEDVEIDDISVVEAHKIDHPELQLGLEPRRLYRNGSLAAHVLGYVGEISEEEIHTGAFPGARPGDLIGKSGAERVYNQLLTGQDGKRRVLVDSMGREVGLLEEQDSIVGGELRLTLDLDLQTAAETMLQNRVGTIVAMDPRNGEVLAMASAPAFDPNTFSNRISEQDWNSLLQDTNRPLQNRALQNSYPPGSTFKIVMAVAGLAEGMVSDDTRVFCTGGAVYHDRVFHCWFKPGHGFVNLENAITRSCNIFFYDLGKRLGISKIARHAQALGLGERTGMDLPGERPGLMPTPEWKQQTRGVKWFAGETISVSIGQGPIRVSPMQLLRAVSAVATGRLTTPHVFLDAEKTEGKPKEWASQPALIDAAAAQRIRVGMWGSVNAGGTGGRANIPGYDICGKTGTVQVVGAERKKEGLKDPAAFEDHSWFVGFAKRDQPEIAIVVFLEHGGKGGSFAAPLAREIFRVFYEKKTQAKENRTPTQLSELRP